MKKQFLVLILFISFFAGAKSGYGQALSLDSISSFPDTIQFDNEVVGMKLYLSNSGGTFFSADLAILIHSITDSTGADTLYYNPAFVLSGNTVGDTINITHTFRAADFDGGDNIVVVWPASSQLPIAVSGDTLTYNLYFKGVGINENEIQQSLQLFPNPSLDMVRLNISHPEKVEQVRVLDVLGKEILHFSSAVTRFNTLSLNGGVYFVEVLNKDHTSVVKKFFRQ